MRAAIIENGKVVNVIEVGSLDFLPGLVACESANMGDLWDGAHFTAAVAPAPAPAVPQSIPMLDARLTLIKAGKMAAVRSYLDSIPGADGELAREYFASALTMKRTHPLVRGIPAEILTAAEKDALFIAAGALNA